MSQPAFSPAVVAEVVRLGGTATAISGSAVDKVRAISFPDQLISEGALDQIADLAAEEGTSAEQAHAETVDHGTEEPMGLLWQAPSVAEADPDNPPAAHLPLVRRADVLADGETGAWEDTLGADVDAVVILGWSDSFPNYAFIREADANPADPEVFSTDHEDYLTAIESEGPLSEYLAGMLDRETLRSELERILAG